MPRASIVWQWMSGVADIAAMRVDAGYEPQTALDLPQIALVIVVEG